MSLDVLCVGDLCVDLVLRGNVRPRFGQVEQLVDDYDLELGGSACIFASQFVKLGGRAGLLGYLGEDVLGSWSLERLRQTGIDLSRVKRRAGLKTGLGVALTEPTDRAILTYPGSIDAVAAHDLSSELLLASRHWHVASYFLLAGLRQAWPSWLRQARQAGMSISLDANWDPEGRWEGITGLLPLVDVFLPNEAEALAISGRRSLAEAGRALAAYGPLVVIKRGADGASAFSGQSRLDAPVPAQIAASLKVIDSVGAGDCFDGGFIRAWQLKLPLADCLAWGMRCGCASLSAAGGLAGQLSESAERMRH